MKKIKDKIDDSWSKHFVSRHEDMFATVLDKIEVEYERQKRIVYEKAIGFPPTPEKVYVVDFYLPKYNLLIEIDGRMKNSSHDKKRELFLKEKGYSILRIMNDQVEILKELKLEQKSNFFDLLSESKRVVMNHRGQYHFVEYEITNVVEYEQKRKETLYNFSVENDESYIANGIVVHNCRCRFIASMKGIE